MTELIFLVNQPFKKDLTWVFKSPDVDTRAISKTFFHNKENIDICMELPQSHVKKSNCVQMFVCVCALSVVLCPHCAFRLINMSLHLNPSSLPCVFCSLHYNFFSKAIHVREYHDRSSQHFTNITFYDESSLFYKNGSLVTLETSKCHRLPEQQLNCKNPAFSFRVNHLFISSNFQNLPRDCRGFRFCNSSQNSVRWRTAVPLIYSTSLRSLQIFISIKYSSTLLLPFSKH